jgi:cytochrome bd ubiquinol oxidase subunit II
MPTLWFILVVFMLSTYVLLDGFDLGAGIIHLVVARNDTERRINLLAIGPVWDGNEVWLIAAAGTLFFTFPLLYASSFSGFYLPLIIVLWLLIVRGVSIELRSRISHPVWFSFWDGMFFLGSALLAFFYGVALGNVVRGVSLNAQGYFFAPLWTDFNPFSANPGILDWYTILIGLLAFATLLLHGANYTAAKTEGIVNERARRIARIGWVGTIALAILASVATFYVQPQVYVSFTQRPWGIIFPLIALVGLLSAVYFNFRKRDGTALLSSGAFILGMLTSAAFSLYPLVLPAANPENSLTIYNSSASQYGLVVGLIWWSIGIVLAVIYFIITYRRFWGKVSAASSQGY